MKKNHSEIVSVLRQAGAATRKALHVAASFGHLDMVKSLLGFGLDVDMLEQDGTPLYFAAGQGHSEIVQELVANGANVNHACVPLCFAATSGDIDTVKALIQLGADVNKRNREGVMPIAHAIVGGHNNVVDYLLPLMKNSLPK